VEGVSKYSDAAIGSDRGLVDIGRALRSKSFIYDTLVFVRECLCRVTVHDGVDGAAGRHANVIGQLSQRSLSLRAPQFGFPAAWQRSSLPAEQEAC
jgi:hypothetical protein